MSFLSAGNRTIHINKKFDEIYQFIQEQTQLGISEIFYLCLLLGYKANRKDIGFTSGRKEFRVAYLTPEQRSIMYIIGNQISGSILFEDITNEELIKNILQEFNSFASGGMEIIVERILKPHMTNGQINTEYRDFSLDLVIFLDTELNNVPF